jgi:hypothetical protein
MLESLQLEFHKGLLPELRAEFYRFARIARIPQGEFLRMMYGRLVFGQYRYPPTGRAWAVGKRYDYEASVRKRWGWTSHEKFVDGANLAFLYFNRECKYYFVEKTRPFLESFRGRNGFQSAEAARYCYDQCDIKKVITLHEHSARAVRS